MACRNQKCGQSLVSFLPAVALVLCLTARADDAAAATTGSAPWNYIPGDTHSPENWEHDYPECGGVMQSPINIVTSQALYDPNLQPFDFSDYSVTSQVRMKLHNVGGHTVQVSLSGRELYLSGGSLPDDYKLEQFHFHWGSDNTRGSEHSINGVFSPLEVHFVHRQRLLTPLSVAASHPYGLAVVAFMFKVGRANNKLEALLQSLQDVQNPNDEVDIQTFSIRDLLPSGDITYYRYYGSLTTPPCYESVIWSVSSQQIEISSQQLARFRTLYDSHNEQLVNDFRPIQDLNGRTVTTNRRR